VAHPLVDPGERAQQLQATRAAGGVALEALPLGAVEATLGEGRDL
jgi:hypothetical protein